MVVPLKRLSPRILVPVMLVKTDVEALRLVKVEVVPLKSYR